MRDTSIHRLYEAAPNGSKRIVRLITQTVGERMVRAGRAERGLDWDGETACYMRQRCARNRNTAAAISPEMQESTSALTLAEVDAIAGTNFKHGKSRTAHLTESQKLSRGEHPMTHRVLPPEDLVELATAKLKAWARIGPAIAALN